jgi:addiction module HigA family antidote
MTIRSFRHKGLRRLFEDDDRRGVAAGQARKIADVLAALDTAEDLADMDAFPGWRLHPLKGDLEGLWSLKRGVTAMPMKNPPHPGGLIRRQVIEPLALSVTEGAAILGVTRQALSLLLNERTGLSSEMALRIEKAFGPKMDHLMRMQLAFDLARQRQREGRIKVKRYSGAAKLHEPQTV